MKNFFKKYLASAIIMLVVNLFFVFNINAQTVFTDDFNRATLTGGGTPSMTYTTTNATGSTTTINGSAFLESTTGGTAGLNYTTGPLATYSTPFNPVLSLNTGIVTWTFNARTTRTSILSGFDASNYGIAVILAADGSNLTTANGYAVVYGKSSATKNFRLVSFAGGLDANANVTDITSSGTTDFSSNTSYVSIRVTYNPVNNEWQLFSRDDGTLTWADPSSGVTAQKGSNTVNTTYTTGATSLTHFGFLWNHATTAGNNAQFDNFTASVSTTPFLNVSSTSLAFGSQAINTSSLSKSFNLTGANLQGIKPLYFAITKEGLAFASEVRALASIDYLKKTNTNWPVFFLAYGHLPEPVTTLQEVKPLCKGCFVRYHIPTAKWEMEVFSFYSFIEKYEDRDEALELVRQHLQKAVKRHLIADAPIGVFLSGGLDSSIIALLAKQQHQSELKTLSIYFKETGYSEKPFQDTMVNQLKCHHHQYLLGEHDFHKYLPEIFSAMDLPSCDGINTWFISKSAKENGLKAVLSGIGGDELFGGYPSFNRIKAANLLANLPSPILKAGRLSGSKKMRRLSYLTIDGPVGMYLFLRGQYIPGEIAAQLDITEKEVIQILSEQPVVNSIRHQTDKNQASWIELNMYMQNQLLRDSDVMSMSQGIEIRVPFLDNSFVKMVHGICTDIKYQGKKEKQLLIDAFKDQLPETIWNRPKMGFSFPFAEWLLNNEMARGQFLSGGKRSIAAWEKFSKGKLHWSQLMSLLLLNQHLREK